MAEIKKYEASDASQLGQQQGPKVNTGYAVNLPNVDPNQSSRWSARLIKPNNKYLNLWVEDASIDFSISGRTGQSRWKREFFPHSFNQPTLKLAGFMPNQREYNKLAAFVRESHSEALNIDKSGTAALNPSERNSKKEKAFPTVTLLMRPNYYQKRNPRNTKGGHRGMKLEGYIKSIKAGGKKFDFAPRFELNFIIAQSDPKIGIYGDNLVGGSELADWMEVFKSWGVESGTEIRQRITKSKQKELAVERLALQIKNNWDANPEYFQSGVDTSEAAAREEAQKRIDNDPQYR